MPLPPGLLLNPQTGELTGVPTEPGTYVITLKVRDALGNQRLITDTVVINAYTTLSWSGSFAPLMRTRAIGAYTLAKAGGLAPFTYSIAGGALPAGLSLNAGTGAITGTPSATGAFSFTLRVTDTLAQTKDVVVSGSVVENLTLSYTSPKEGTVSVALAANKTVGGGTAPITYAVTAGAVPAGLSLSSSTGNFSGTPTAATSGAGNALTVTATDANGFTATGNITIDIAVYPTVSGSLVRSMVNKAGYSRTFTGSGGHTAYSWSSDGLPSGLSINSGTGEVTGTPSGAGTFTALIRLTDALGVQAVSAAQIVEIATILNIGGSYNAAPTRGQTYLFQPSVSGGFMPRAFSISAGALPAGLTLDTANGTISGALTTQANYTATLRVTDADGSTAQMAFNVNVSGDLSITGDIPATGTTTVAFSGDNLGVTGGTAPHSWSVSSGILPHGVTINTSTGDLTGTPTTAGTYNFTIRVTDANNSWAEFSDTVVVASYPTLSGDLGDATNGAAYSQQLSRAGGHAPYAFDISAGALPNGLSINASNGTVSGTPTVNGAFSFTVRCTDNVGNVITKADSITVYAAVGLSGAYASDAEAPYSNGVDPYEYSSNSVTATGGKAPLVWSLAGGTLPPGLTLNSSTGLIFGSTGWASEASGQGYTDYVFQVRVTDALGSTAVSANHIIRLFWHVIKAPGGFPSGTVGVAYNQTVPAFYGKSPYTHAAQTALPAGLSIAAGTGAISGTPTVAGNYGMAFRYTDNLNKSHDWSQTFVVNPAVTISGDAPVSTVGKAYSFAYTKSGGNGIYSFSLVSGAVPTGMSLDTTNGIVGGTPTTAGTYNFTVRVTSGGSTADIADSIQVNAQPTLSLSYPHGTVSQTYGPGSVTANNGWPPYSFSVASGALPPGLSLNSSTGALTGTPSVAGTHSFQIRLTDSLGNTATTATSSIVVAAALNIPGAFAGAQQNTAYSSQVTATGGWPGYSFSHVGGTLPAGLSLAANGTLSGTPTTATTYNFTVRVTDADGDTFDKAMQVIVEAPAFNVSISPNPGYDSAFSGGSAVTAMEQCTASVTGASGTVSYQWTKIVAGSGTAFAASGTTTATLTVQHTTRHDYESTEKWRVTATTSTSQVDTADVEITLMISGGL